MALLDIESLVERVRSQAAKSFIDEAVRCYQIGAYRSCVVATWIALVYDLLDKLRELALAGDSVAATHVEKFERNQVQRDTIEALKFEREILDVAKNQFELVSEQECVDLRRLFEDRNRFAHPNLNQDYESLLASAELARAHLRSAVEHVLSRPPVQGKAALVAIRGAVDSDYFPKETADALIALKATPLARAKKSVVREFYLGCLISLIRESLAIDSWHRRLAAAEACKQLHPDVVLSMIEEKVTSIFDTVDGSGLGYLLFLISKSPDFQTKVSAAQRLRLGEYVKQLKGPDLPLLPYAASVPFLASEFALRVDELGPYELREVAVKHSSKLPGEFLTKAVSLLQRSKNWDSSNSICEAVSERMIHLMDRPHAEAILNAASNDEVKYAFKYAPLVSSLIAGGFLTAEESGALDGD